jgi:hypothetical protein
MASWAACLVVKLSNSKETVAMIPMKSISKGSILAEETTCNSMKMRSTITTDFHRKMALLMDRR